MGCSGRDYVSDSLIKEWGRWSLAEGEEALTSEHFEQLAHSVESVEVGVGRSAFEARADLIASVRDAMR